MAKHEEQLSVIDHRRDRLGLKYVYPVVSRRAGGVSVGINLNTNNACNWACSYCQVPGLIRGGPEPIDLGLLDREIRGFLADLLQGAFMHEKVPVDARRLADIAFSGNGEPTSSKEFPQAVDLVIEAMRAAKILATVPLRLITNGSLVHRQRVRETLAKFDAVRGEVWFKVDRATSPGILATNGVRLTPERSMERLLLCADLAPTWIQTCWFGLDGAEPSLRETTAYLEFVARLRGRIRGVLLYGIARQPMQAAAARLTRLSPETLECLARQIESCGVDVTVSP